MSSQTAYILPTEFLKTIHMKYNYNKYPAEYFIKQLYLDENIAKISKTYFIYNL